MLYQSRSPRRKVVRVVAMQAEAGYPFGLRQGSPLAVSSHIGAKEASARVGPSVVDADDEFPGGVVVFHVAVGLLDLVEGVHVMDRDVDVAVCDCLEVVL